MAAWRSRRGGNTEEVVNVEGLRARRGGGAGNSGAGVVVNGPRESRSRAYSRISSVPPRQHVGGLRSPSHLGRHRHATPQRRERPSTRVVSLVLVRKGREGSLR